MSVSPSDTMLNHVVTVTRGVDCADESGSGDEEFRAALRPMPVRDVVALGYEVDQPVMRVYFRDNAALVKGNRIHYTDANGNGRYVEVETFTDQMVMGQLFKAEGRDFPE